MKYAYIFSLTVGKAMKLGPGKAVKQDVLLKEFGPGQRSEFKALGITHVKKSKLFRICCPQTGSSLLNQPHFNLVSFLL